MGDIILSASMNLLLAISALSLWLIFNELHQIRKLLQAKEKAREAATGEREQSSG